MSAQPEFTVLVAAACCTTKRHAMPMANLIIGVHLKSAFCCNVQDCQHRLCAAFEAFGGGQIMISRLNVCIPITVRGSLLTEELVFKPY